MPIPVDYEERVYAGILGKIIGVYLGRPFEGWPYRRIMDELGEVTYYVNDRLDRPLVVPDDDISGTLTFIRALEDHGICRDITPEQIGNTWLNYLIEERTTLWWGGMGASTEHTAYLRLKAGVPAPRSGSADLNTREVAEQVGAQIFIDSWAMVAPGDPELAADLAARAASVSHDGEAVRCAQALAAMEAAAFFESDIPSLLDIGLGVIPPGSTTAGLHRDIREWHARDDDWHRTFGRIEEKYGYERYGGGCHTVPNHAVIVLALLYGAGDFQETLKVANTAGWDTDCNSGNVGCLLGIRNGLSGLETGPDWRGAVADRIVKVSADGGDAVTDAVRETYRICRIGRALLGVDALPAPKGGARCHFELPGSVQGFLAEGSPELGDAVRLENVAGYSRIGSRSLAIQLNRIAGERPVRVSTGVFAAPEEGEGHGYRTLTSPTLYPGQTVEADLQLGDDADGPIGVALYVRVHPCPVGDWEEQLYSPELQLEPGSEGRHEWRVPDTRGLPVVALGLECRVGRRTSGTLYLDRLTWAGVPSCRFTGAGMGCQSAPIGWMDATDRTRVSRELDGVRIDVIQNEGRGMLLNGTQDWEDYRLSARVTPHMASEAGIAVRVGGMRRFYALLLCHGGRLRLIRCCDREEVLAEADLAWEPNQDYLLSLSASGDRLTASVDGKGILTARDTVLPHGAIALINTEGRTAFSELEIEPV